MAGGIGARFWPMSTPEHPKQFMDILGCGRTMIQQACDRFGPAVAPERVWVVTGAAYKEIVGKQLPGVLPEHILLEPCPRNTAPAIAYACWKIHCEDPDAVVAVAPSDHVVLDENKFASLIDAAFDFAAKGERIVTLGVCPSRPETGYGYIEQGAVADPVSGAFKVESFREKPDAETALRYLRSGTFLWNCGIFLWRADTIISEIRRAAVELATLMDRIAAAFGSPSEQTVLNELFPNCPKISIDYAVMENTSLAWVIPCEFGWSDVGTWGSLYQLSQHDAYGNVVIGDSVRVVESEGCMVHVPDGKRIVIQGLKDCIVVEHDGTTLICQLRDEQRIKDWHE